jgi:hypothetical protein
MRSFSIATATFRIGSAPVPSITWPALTISIVLSFPQERFDGWERKGRLQW